MRARGRGDRTDPDRVISHERLDDRKTDFNENREGGSFIEDEGGGTGTRMRGGVDSIETEERPTSTQHEKRAT